MTAKRTRKRAPAPAPALITRDMIAAQKNDIEYRLVDVPEWGGQVRLRSLTAGDKLDIQSRIRATAADPGAPEKLSLDLVLFMLVDANGAPMFERTDADRELLRQANADGFVIVLREAFKFAGLGITLEGARKN